MKIAVFAADERMKIVAQELKRFSQIIEIDENDSLCKLRKMASEFQAVVLPAWGIEEDGFIRMQTRGLFAAEFLESLDESCVLFSGKECEFFKHLKCRICCWLNDEEVLKQNADLTSEGLLCRLIETTERSLWNYQIDIIGTGRCGTSMAYLLKKLGISYRMITSSHQKIEDTEMIDLNSWQHENPSELIINTAPVCVMNQQVLKHWKQRCHVYDLATGGCGVDEKCRKHPFLKLWIEPALPARFSPLSAAQLICQAIEKELRE